MPIDTLEITICNSCFVYLYIGCNTPSDSVPNTHKIQATDFWEKHFDHCRDLQSAKWSRLVPVGYIFKSSFGL